MRRRWTAMLVLAAVAMVPEARAAVGVSVGYDTVGGTFEYMVRNLNTKGNNGTETSEDINVGAPALAGELLMPVNDWLGVGISVGAGTGGSWEFDLTKLFVPVPGEPNPNAGDTLSAVITRMPVLVKGEVSTKAGPGRMVVGLGAGMTVVGITSEQADAQWTDGLPGGDQNDMDLTHTTPYGTQTDYVNDTVSLFTLEVTPGFRFKLGQKGALGIEIPLSIMAKKTVSGQLFDYATPPGNFSDPGHTVPTASVGGFAWGVRVGWTHRI